MNNGFTSGVNSEQIAFVKKKKARFSKKSIFMLFVYLVIIGCAILIGLRLFGDDYSLEVSIPDVIYMNDEDASLSFGLNGGSKISKNLNTIFTVYDEEILSLSDVEASGEAGYVKIIPNSLGSTKITVNTSLLYEDSEDEKELASKEVTVVVCPSFDNSLFSDNSISVNKDGAYILQLNTDANCLKNVYYLSDNTDVMVVSDDGVIYGLNPGKANLVVSNGDKEFTIPVIVN